MVNIKGVTQRGENTYRFTVSTGFDGNGKHIRKTTTFKVPEDTAPTKVGKIVSKAYSEFCERYKGKKKLNENMRFKELVELYLRDYAPNELKPATRYNYEKDLQAHMLPVFGNKKIKDIDVSDLSAFFTGLGLAPESCRKMRIITSSVFSFGVKQEYIKENPCLKSLYKKDTYGEKDKKYYDKITSKKLIELTSEYSVFNIILQVLLLTGMRCGECLSLEWENISFDNETIRIEKTLTYADKEWFFTAPKTQKSRRTIKMSPFVKKILENHKRHQEEQKKVLGTAWVVPDLVFTSAKGNFYDRSYLNTQFRNFLKKNNMPKITIHGLRHSNASLMIDNGINIKAVSAHLGHSNIAITGDIYSHVFDEYEAKIANVIELELV